jgi:hypothetical protein
LLGVGGVVLLVIVLGRIERLEGRNLGDDRRREGLLFVEPL